jgi:hypothetical protein
VFPQPGNQAGPEGRKNRELKGRKNRELRQKGDTTRRHTTGRRCVGMMARRAFARSPVERVATGEFFALRLGFVKRILPEAADCKHEGAFLRGRGPCGLGQEQAHTRKVKVLHEDLHRDSEHTPIRGSASRRLVPTWQMTQISFSRGLFCAAAEPPAFGASCGCFSLPLLLPEPCAAAPTIPLPLWHGLFNAVAAAVTSATALALAEEPAPPACAPAAGFSRFAMSRVAASLPFSLACVGKPMLSCCAGLGVLCGSNGFLHVFF